MQDDLINPNNIDYIMEYGLDNWLQRDTKETDSKRQGRLYHDALFLDDDQFNLKWAIIPDEHLTPSGLISKSKSAQEWKQLNRNFCSADEYHDAKACCSKVIEVIESFDDEVKDVNSEFVDIKTMKYDYDIVFVSRLEDRRFSKYKMSFFKNPRCLFIEKFTHRTLISELDKDLHFELIMKARVLRKNPHCRVVEAIT